MPRPAIYPGFSAFLTGVFALTLGLLVTLTASQGARAADRDRVEAFLQVTGFDVALDSIALAAEDAPTMLGLRAEEFGFQWKQAAEEVFERELMHGMALDILEQALSDELLSHAAIRCFISASSSLSMARNSSASIRRRTTPASAAAIKNRN